MTRACQPLKAAEVAKRKRFKCEHKPAAGVCMCCYMFVYFVEMNGFIKIGKSRDWQKRMEQFRTGSPFEINVLMVVVGGLDFEAELHAKFMEHHHKGEWFRDCKEIRDFIDGTRWSNRVEKHNFNLRYDA
jgi:mRNA-degrading endonuclease YafQ of YafQ-DinJ toxin-antitoxin module